ncbi:MAG TPA: hypothetical protein D7H89_00520 [Candidatus Poseidoniales archaeon]|nr:MAG TPA: hypothetical protein D7H89_00520 [Candidatus Poseidoniales archaeon]
MQEFDKYHPNDRVIWSLTTLLGFGGFATLLLFVWDVPSLLTSTGTSLMDSTGVYSAFIWRLFCLMVGISAIIYMFRMKTGHMIVRSHQKKEDILIHPLGIRKFVTFSSWTLLLNVAYFFLATLSSFAIVLGFDLSESLNQALAGTFVTALGASFLTSTVVRYVILPGDYTDDEHHQRQFWFHNQVMHNFCTIFLVTEIIITTPQLEFSYMLFGILIGLTYALFAFPFAVFGGGYYCYPFIDPRLRKAPLFIMILALAISISYVGVWLASEFIFHSSILGRVVLVLWCASIVQFRPLSQPSELALRK